MDRSRKELYNRNEDLIQAETVKQFLMIENNLQIENDNFKIGLQTKELEVKTIEVEVIDE
jgi:hypothetical protein